MHLPVMLVSQKRQLTTNLEISQLKKNRESAPRARALVFLKNRMCILNIVPSSPDTDIDTDITDICQGSGAEAIFLSAPGQGVNLKTQKKFHSIFSMPNGLKITHKKFYRN